MAVEDMVAAAEAPVVVSEECPVVEEDNMAVVGVLQVVSAVDSR